MRGDPADWKFGWRLEDLEQRIASQKEVLTAESQELDMATPGLLERIASHTWHHQRPEAAAGAAQGLTAAAAAALAAKTGVLGGGGGGGASGSRVMQLDPTLRSLATDLFKV